MIYIQSPRNYIEYKNSFYFIFLSLSPFVALSNSTSKFNLRVFGPFKIRGNFAFDVDGKALLHTNIFSRKSSIHLRPAPKSSLQT